MLRLKFDALDSRENEFYYEGKLFTGIAFETSQGRLLDAVYIQNGIRQRPYVGDYVKVIPGDMRLEADCEGLLGEQGYDLMIFEGVLYNGVLYEFNNNFCIGESAFLKGERIISMEWHENGRISSYSNVRNGIGDGFDWHENGLMKSIHIIKVLHVSLWAEFDEKGCLKVLQITHSFFATQYDLPAHSFPAINKLSDLARFKVSSFLLLGGRGISVDVFQILSENGLETLEIFKSFDTLLGYAEFDTIAQLQHVRLIDIENGEGSDLTIELTKIKEHRPHIEVNYNNLRLPKRTPILRLKAEILISLGTTLYYKGNTFSGIAFWTNRGHLTEAFYYENGKRLGLYIGDYLDIYDRIRLEADCEGITRDSGSDLTRFYGAFFTGILYEFEDNFCVGESVFLIGELALSVKWHHTGVLASYKRLRNGLSNISLTWYDNGQLQRIHTMKKPDAFLMAEFSRQGDLAMLEITDNYFYIDVVPLHKLPFQLIHEISDFDQFRASSTLSLTGRGVRSGILRALTVNNGLAGVEILNIFETSLNEEDCVKVIELPLLRHLNIRDRDSTFLDHLRKITTLRSDLDVQYNNKAFR